MKKLPLKSIKKKLWKLRSEYYRRRCVDNSDMATCFTCNKRVYWKEGDAGHYISRIYDHTTELLNDDRNVHAQCKSCNGYHSGRQPEYAIHLQAKYGEKVLVELQAKKNTPRHWKYSEIEELIKVYQIRIKEL